MARDKLIHGKQTQMDTTKNNALAESSQSVVSDRIKRPVPSPSDRWRRRSQCKYYCNDFVSQPIILFHRT